VHLAFSKNLTKSLIRVLLPEIKKSSSWVIVNIQFRFISATCELVIVSTFSFRKSSNSSVSIIPEGRSFSKLGSGKKMTLLIFLFLFLRALS